MLQNNRAALYSVFCSFLVVNLLSACATLTQSQQAKTSSEAPALEAEPESVVEASIQSEPYEEAVAAATDPLSPKRLILVSRYGHTKIVTYLLQNNVDPNTRDRFENTALIAASEGGHVDVIKLLLNAGAEANVANREGKTPLMGAAARGSENIVRVLLDAGAEIDSKDSTGETALFYAVKNGFLSTTQILLTRGADTNLKNESRVNTSISGYTPLMYAANHGYEGISAGEWTAIVAALLEKNANPNLRNRHGASALSIAERRSDQDIIALLGNAGARQERSYTSLNENLALIKAARIGDTNKVQSLLKAGAKPDVHNTAGVTPLLSATYENKIAVVKILVNHGANLNLVPIGLREYAFSASSAPLKERELMKSATWGDTPLLLAIRRGHTRIVEYFLEKGANPELANHRGETPIFVAAAGGQAKDVKLLLDKGVDPNTLETEKLTVSMTNTLQVMGRNTPLITASQAGHTDVVRVLLEAGADANHQGFFNRTALFWAVERGYAPTVEVLLKNKANPNLNDVEGLTPLIVSSRNGNKRIVELLIKYEAELNQPEFADIPGEGGKAFNTTGMTALIYASRGGHDLIVTILIKAGADVNLMSKGGETAISEASNNGYKDIVEQLTLAGAR